MKFSTRADIDAPIDHVFAELSDFPAFERGAMRRGALVKRLDSQQVRGPGMQWQADFTWRGRARTVLVDLADFDGPNHIGVSGKSGGLNGFCDIELIELSPKKTRMKLALDLKPQTLSARLLIQSLKLAKGSVDKRFQSRVAEYSSEIAARYRKSA